MIKKLINRLLGKTSAEPQAPAEPGATAARKTRAPKAPKVAKARTKASAGGVPRQARVWSVDEHGIDPKLLSRNAVKVTSTLQDAGYAAFIVGGAVRDLLLGIKPKDFDVATNATPDQVVPSHLPLPLHIAMFGGLLVPSESLGVIFLNPFAFCI